MKLKDTGICDKRGQKLEGGFSILDLAVLITTAAFLSCWFGYMHKGERGRTTRCAGNLAALGKAMGSYAHEKHDALPAAAVNLKGSQTSWDMDVFPYLGSGLKNASNQKLAEVVPQFFACPSDNVPRQGKTRSYAMSGNDMRAENWPPGPDSNTGVGLVWDRTAVLTLLYDETLLQSPDKLPGVTSYDVKAPADTLLLTEFVDDNNTMGSVRQTVVFGASQQRQIFKDGGAGFHNGRFNYLMVDGHVESLSPLQTGAFDGTAGIWSLKKQK